MMVIKNRPSKMKLFWCQVKILKMGVKMNFRIRTKNHAADSKIRSPHKIDFRADSRVPPDSLGVN